MGVWGLKTLLDTHRHALQVAETRGVVLKSDDAGVPNRETGTPLIIDAYGLIFSISRALPFAVDGGYTLFARSCRQYLEALRTVGFEPIIVLDGASQSAKEERLLERMMDSIRKLNTVQRASESLRKSDAFMKSCHILPCLSPDIFLQALKTIDPPIETHVLQTEADQVIFELACQRNAYILSSDSDFAIFSHATQSHRGSIALDSLEWIQDVGQETPEAQDGFVTVSKRPKQPASHFLPTQFSHLNYITYHPQRLADFLRIPVRLLSLVAVLAGNDYISFALTKFIWPQGSGGDHTARFTKIANAIQRASAKPSTSPEYFYRKVLLLLQPSLQENELLAFIEAIQSTIAIYLLPQPAILDQSPLSQYYASLLDQGQSIGSILNILGFKMTLANIQFEDIDKRSCAEHACRKALQATCNLLLTYGCLKQETVTDENSTAQNLVKWHYRRQNRVSTDLIEPQPIETLRGVSTENWLDDPRTRLRTFCEQVALYSPLDQQYQHRLDAVLNLQSVEQQTVLFVRMFLQSCVEMGEIMSQRQIEALITMCLIETDEKIATTTPSWSIINIVSAWQLSVLAGFRAFTAYGLFTNVSKLNLSRFCPDHRITMVLMRPDEVMATSDSTQLIRMKSIRRLIIDEEMNLRITHKLPKTGRSQGQCEQDIALNNRYAMESNGT